MLLQIKQFLRREAILCLAVFLACASSLFQAPRLAYIDFDVLCVLLSLMLVVAGLKQVLFLDYVAVELLNRCVSRRQLTLALVGITYVSSMFVTNDVALLTFVPLALVIGKTLQLDMERSIILQTLAANLGSMLTPPGNPQNLFLYAHYNYTAGRFFCVMALPCLLSLAYIGVLIFRRPDAPLTLTLPGLPRPERRTTLVLLALLLVNIAAVLHVLPKLWALGVTLAAVLLLNRRLLLAADYSLLLTFIGFFIFIGNISHTSIAAYLQGSLLGTATGTYLAALLSSQFISNVPAAMLLAGLTQEADALLLGVNIGGLGTMIASMASVISYKLFVAEQPTLAGRYLLTFLYYNFAGLLLIGGLVYCII
ncbi:SLC13 family permease [uncultured Phascolarctobacterium sp.]|uniref:SLC13 family permease n=1 Tax=uncultured Phascolarctobacterium sp. TaxID=512296 RepID=UPI002635912D|nr:SLC13 family permease [uncultured Phascolarctobacterium sp.]